MRRGKIPSSLLRDWLTLLLLSSYEETLIVVPPTWQCHYNVIFLSVCNMMAQVVTEFHTCYARKMHWSAFGRVTFVWSTLCLKSLFHYNAINLLWSEDERWQWSFWWWKKSSKYNILHATFLQPEHPQLKHWLDMLHRIFLLLVFLWFLSVKHSTVL